MAPKPLSAVLPGTVRALPPSLDSEASDPVITLDLNVKITALLFMSLFISYSSYRSGWVQPSHFRTLVGFVLEGIRRALSLFRSSSFSSSSGLVDKPCADTPDDNDNLPPFPSETENLESTSASSPPIIATSPAFSAVSEGDENHIPSINESMDTNHE